MRFEFVWNLRENDILAKPVYNNKGIVLLKSGLRLTSNYINKLKENTIYHVYIEDDNLGDIEFDERLTKYKYTALQNMPEIFKSLMDSDYESVQKSFKVVDEIVEYIINEGNINTNLYEINQYDDYTYIHCIDTSIMATFLGLELGLNKNELRELAAGAILHDIGKIKIPQEIINKSDVLNQKEIDIIRKHTIYGYEILKKAGFTQKSILLSVLQHHERVNGSGYPFGLTGDNISKYARIISICDVFTAISANRSYRKRFNPNEAYEYIIGGVGTSFDNEVVDKFKKTFSIYPLGSCVMLSNGIEGYVVKQNKGFPDRPVVRVIYDYSVGSKAATYEINLVENVNLVISSIVTNRKL